MDLNSPVLISDAAAPADPKATPGPNGSTPTYQVRYPIVDGNNLKGGLLNPDHTTNASSVLSYDADGDGTADIEGFSVQQPPTYDATKPVAPNNNPVPMPARWLYQLQNGELHARDATGNIPDASASNPAVGRVAFWTDDDTAKLNVNTASEGTFWDRPWASTATEVNFGTYYPAQNEFQMYPGHPAKTCLSTVFGSPSLWPVDAFLTSPYSSSSNYSKLLPYYDLVPRVTEGVTHGSAGGTQLTGTTTGIPYDGNRLYASLDEIMFQQPVSGSSGPTRTSRNVVTTTTAGGTTYNVPAISPQFLETTRFFLTASNRAPEVTMMNTPRISLWPIDSDYQNSKDKLLAFCSTLPSNSTYTYYFQRANSGTSPSNTAPAAPACNSTTIDAQYGRNLTLDNYLVNLLNAKIPGLGGSFSGGGSKYSSGATSQVAAEMLDQIRSGVNTIAAGGDVSVRLHDTATQFGRGTGRSDADRRWARLRPVQHHRGSSGGFFSVQQPESGPRSHANPDRGGALPPGVQPGSGFPDVVAWHARGDQWPG